MTLQDMEACGLVVIKESHMEDFLDILLLNNYTAEISNAEENKVKILIKKEKKENETN